MPELLFINWGMFPNRSPVADLGEGPGDPGSPLFRVKKKKSQKREKPAGKVN